MNKKGKKPAVCIRLVHHYALNTHPFLVLRYLSDISICWPLPLSILTPRQNLLSLWYASSAPAKTASVFHLRKNLVLKHINLTYLNFTAILTLTDLLRNLGKWWFIVRRSGSAVISSWKSNSSTSLQSTLPEHLQVITRASLTIALQYWACNYVLVCVNVRN